MKKETLANPSPIGLAAFGVTTVFLNIHNAGFFPINSAVIGLGFFFGGIAQVLAGLLEYKKGNAFGMTAFIAFGCFWLSLVGLLVLPNTGLAAVTDNRAFGIYLMLWGAFTLLMFFATLQKNRAIQFVFASLVVLFFLLGLGNITENQFILTLAGYEGILCGSSAIYLAIAEIYNETYDREILPIGKIVKHDIS